jgi:hypothetical protein
MMLMDADDGVLPAGFQLKSVRKSKVISKTRTMLDLKITIRLLVIYKELQK